MYVNFKTWSRFLEITKGRNNVFSQKGLTLAGLTTYAAKDITHKLRALGYLQESLSFANQTMWRVVNRDVLEHFISEGRTPPNVSQVKVKVDHSSIMKSFYTPSTKLSYRRGALDAFSLPSRGAFN